MRIKKNTFKDILQREKLKGILGAYADTAAKQLERDAKLNAPWVDRTGNARNSIQGGSGFYKNNLMIAVGGNVDYFKHLELANAKKYAVLKPTVAKNAQSIMAGYRKLFR